MWMSRQWDFPQIGITSLYGAIENMAVWVVKTGGIDEERIYAGP